MAKKWYVIQTYSGYEAKVKEALLQRIKEHHMEDRFGEVLIPTETVTEQRAGGKSRTRQKTSFPGYIFVEMEMSEEVWHLVKDTPKVTGFIGNQRPQEVTPPQIDDLRKSIVEGAVKPKPRVTFEAGDEIRVIDGAFANFSGTVEEVKPDKQKLTREGLHLRPRHAGRARFQSGREEARGLTNARALTRRGTSMAKKVAGIVKLQLPAGKASPAPPVGPALGPHGINIMAFCKEFNAKTQGSDMIIPVVLTVYSDRSFSMVLKTPPDERAPQEGRRPVDGQEARRRLEGAEQDQGRQGLDEAGARARPAEDGDMNCTDIESAMRTVMGTARSMGIDVVE